MCWITGLFLRDSWCARREKRGRGSAANAEIDRGRPHEPSGGSTGRVLREQPAENGFAAFAERNEQAQAPGDDFADKAKRFQGRNRTLAKACEFDAIASQHLALAKRKAVAKSDGTAFAQQKLDCRFRRRGHKFGVEAKGSTKVRKIVGLDETADEPLSVFRGEPEDAAEEGEVVRRIYRDASGKSLRHIARDLNRDGIPAPRGLPGPAIR